VRYKSRYILCEDGSYLHVRNVTRLFVVEDGVTRRGNIKASVIGPAMPFTVAEYDTQHEAELALQALIAQLEGDSK